jgi:hypothetical protein
MRDMSDLEGERPREPGERYVWGCGDVGVDSGCEIRDSGWGVYVGLWVWEFVSEGSGCGIWVIWRASVPASRERDMCGGAGVDAGCEIRDSGVWRFAGEIKVYEQVYE